MMRGNHFPCFLGCVADTPGHSRSVAKNPCDPSGGKSKPMDAQKFANLLFFYAFFCFRRREGRIPSGNYKGIKAQ
jgi:hypothetical protein